MSRKNYQVIVIGASAGAFEALSVILPALPAGYPVPVVVVVHIPPDKKSVMPELMGQRCRVNVREAEDKEPLHAGTVYFAPPDYHVMIENNQHLSLSSEEPVLFSRPSIDVLFETAADAYGENVLGIVLTGANSDGALGLKAIDKAGGGALILRPDVAYVPTMPQAAANACPDAPQLSLEEIADYLKEIGSA